MTAFAKRAPSPPAKRSPARRARTATPRVFQIHYLDSQRSRLDPAFEPYDNIGVRDPLLEFNVFRTILREGIAGDAPLWGAVSWKFGDKTGLAGDELKRFIAANPGYDAYYCNPFPEFEGIYHNLWQQGETAHPGFLELVRELFRAGGLPIAAIDALYPASMFAAANYIVATPAFWQAYVRFVESLIARIEARASVATLERLYSPEADARGRHAKATYLPFVVERLFPVFLVSRQAAAFRTVKYPLPAKEARLDEHLKILRQKKEFTCLHQNRHLAVWWISHRNLYLVAQHGKVWAGKYLPRITPGKIHFLAPDAASPVAGIMEGAE